MIRRRLRTLLLALVASLFVTASAGAEIIDRIVARVNDDVVTLHDVRRAAVPFLLQNGQNPALLQNPAQRDEIWRATLDDLVERNLIAQDARKIDYKVSEADLQQWLTYNAQQRNLSQEQFQQLIEQLGVPWKDYEEIARQNLLRMAMIRIKVGSQISVTPEDVEARYRAEYGDGAAQERYRTIQHILVRPEGPSPEQKQAAIDTLQELRARIEAGESFDDIAREFSQGPSAPRGGLIGAYKRGDLDPNFEAVAFSIELGKVSEPVESSFGLHLIYVVDEELREGADVEERRATIRMRIQQEEMERLMKKYVSELRARAFVDVRL